MNLRKFGKFISLILSATLLITGLTLTGCRNNTDEPVATDSTPVPTRDDVTESISKTDTVKLANALSNGVQGFYNDESRSEYIVENLNSAYKVNLTKDENGLGVIYNKDYVPYIEGGMTSYAVTEGGKEYTTLMGGDARINTSQLGLYYYSVNVRDLDFFADYSSEELESVDITNRTVGDLSSNQITEPEISGNSIVFEVTEVTDPYVAMPVSFSTEKYNTVIINMTVTGEASSCHLYYFTSDQSGYQGEQYINFTVKPDGKSHYYYIDFSEISGSVAGLRLDVNGSTPGTKVKLHSIEAGQSRSENKLHCGFEQTIHSYSDKYHNQLRLIYDKNTENVDQFGYEYKIPESSVLSLKFRNGNGVSDDISEFGVGQIEYVVFDIKDAGLFGIIIPHDQNTCVSLEKKDGFYILRHYIDVSGKHAATSDSVFSHRIYYSNKHDFEDVEKENYIERNPLSPEVISVESGTGYTYAGYNTLTGAYGFTVRGISFSEAYENYADKHFGGTVKFTGDSKYDRAVYVICNGESGSLEASVLLNENSVLLPVSVQVSKNFCGEIEEPYYDPKDPAYGNSIYPIAVPKDGSYTHTMLDIYEKWGLNRLKQISSVAFHISYYHLSTGVTESNCISPYFVFGRDGWTLPDFRGPSGIMWESQPQYNSVGRLRFLSHVVDGVKNVSEYTGSKINSTGTSYADVEYSYKNGNAVTYTLRHVEFPQTDENRTYYTMTVNFNQDFSVESVRDSFTLFDFDGRYNGYRKLSYKDENGNIQDVNIDLSGASDVRKYVLSKETPFFSYYDYTPAETDTMNFALLVKDYEVILNGSKWDGNLLLRDSTFSEGAVMNMAELTLDMGKTTFKKGDSINVSMILLPYGLKEQTDDQNVHTVYEDSIEKPWRIDNAAVGTVVEDTYLARIKAESNVAEFSVTGGRNACVIRVDGFTVLAKPVLQENINGVWEDVVYSVHDYDGYQVNYNDDGTYSYSFVINQDSPDDNRSFRVTVG